MKEYVFKISSRDPEHPIVETLLIELGFHESSPDKLIGGLAAVVEILKVLKTPEAVSEFMLRNSQLAKANLLTRR